MKRRSFILAGLAGFGGFLISGGSSAEEAGPKVHEVKMLNRGAEGSMVFEPSLVRIAPGEAVRFIPTHRSHNAESIPEMTPEGGETFKGRINEDITATFTKLGAYGVKCQPHLAMGMIALIVVGEDPANLDDIRGVKLPTMARRRLDAMLEGLN